MPFVVEIETNLPGCMRRLSANDRLSTALGREDGRIFSVRQAGLPPEMNTRVGLYDPVGVGRGAVGSLLDGRMGRFGGD